MPLPEHTIPVEPVRPVVLPAALQVRWSSLRHARFDHLGATRSHEGPNGKGHARIDLVISVQLLGPDRAMLEAWLELPCARKTIFARQALAAETTADGEMRHLDCHHDGRRLLALTLAGEDTIIYAQSDLLAAAGFTGGMYDPPTACAVHVAREAVSA